MADLLGFLGMIQSNGGLMVGFAWLVWEVRSIRRDFNRHQHDDEGRPFLQVLHD